MIPDDWEAMAIADSFRFLRTIAVSRSGYVESGSLHCVHYGDLHTKWQTVLDFSREAVPCVPDSYLKQADLIQDGDVIIADASEDLAGVGACAEVQGLADKRAIGGLHTYVLRPQPAQWVRGFTGYILQSTAVRNQIERLAAGLKVYGISKTALNTVVIPWPSEGERKFISEALSNMDEAIAAQEAVIAKKRALKTATMQALLSGTRRLPGFSREWEEKALDKVCPMQRGFDLPMKQIRPGKVPVVYSNGISAHHDKAMVKGPGIVTGRSGTIGNVHFVEDDFWPHNTSLWVTSMCGNDARFLVYFLRRLNLSNFSSGSGVPTLNRNDFHSHRVKIPEPAEQTAIANVLFDMDLDLANSEKGLAKLKVLKVGMMQKLLTGKIRLV